MMSEQEQVISLAGNTLSGRPIEIIMYWHSAKHPRRDDQKIYLARFVYQNKPMQLINISSYTEETSTGRDIQPYGPPTEENNLPLLNISSLVDDLGGENILNSWYLVNEPVRGLQVTSQNKKIPNNTSINLYFDLVNQQAIYESHTYIPNPW